MPKHVLGLFQASYYFTFAQKFLAYSCASNLNPQLIAKNAALRLQRGARNLMDISSLTGKLGMPVRGDHIELVVNPLAEPDPLKIGIRELFNRHDRLSLENMEFDDLRYVRDLVRAIEGRQRIDSLVTYSSCQVTKAMPASALVPSADIISSDGELMEQTVALDLGKGSTRASASSSEASETNTMSSVLTSREPKVPALVRSLTAGMSQIVDEATEEVTTLGHGPGPAWESPLCSEASEIDTTSSVPIISEPKALLNSDDHHRSTAVSAREAPVEAHRQSMLAAIRYSLSILAIWLAILTVFLRLMEEDREMKMARGR